SETNHTDPLKRFHNKQNTTNAKNSNNKDVFTNNTSNKIREKLTNRQDIRRAQVAVTKTRAIISVQLSDHANREDILDSIQHDTEPMVPNKDIVIYTNDSYWNRMKKLGSELKNLTDDDDIDHYIDKYFDE
ncbi:MAG TPA: YhcN/YlaJ family sporulation lipoprotein, partial [Bacillota bacterium]|nr:YhcN/YlaJ family sporulation lipoprotein [Bacillota bacterium]